MIINLGKGNFFSNLFSNQTYIVDVTYIFHLHKDLKRAERAEIYYPICIWTFVGVFLYLYFHSTVKYWHIRNKWQSIIVFLCLCTGQLILCLQSDHRIASYLPTYLVTISKALWNLIMILLSVHSGLR